MSRMVVWSLFDSGNGSYHNVLKNMDDVENFSIGLDIENKNTHFINIDLSDYSFLFGKDKLIERLNQLPKPDIIIASPPCESWSVASAMRGGECMLETRTSRQFIRSTNTIIKIYRQRLRRLLNRSIQTTEKFSE